MGLLAHLWVGEVPQPSPGARAICGQELEQPIRPAPRCYYCAEEATAQQLALGEQGYDRA